MERSDILVSIIVAAYNSSKYILETLESIKQQTYEKIELIVTDDGSKDNTVELAEKWIAQNKERFINSELIKVSTNTGIPANCNRGVLKSNGAWIKLIAADDILFPHAIESSVIFATKNNFKIFVSDMEVFNADGVIEAQTINYHKMVRWFTEKSQIDQKRSYIRIPIMVNIPTVFYEQSLYFEVGQYDEEIKLMEDQPFFIKCFNKGYRIGFNNDVTVRYRKHDSSVMQSSNLSFLDDLYLSFLKYRKPELKNYILKDFVFKNYFELSYFIKKNRLENFLISKLFLKAINVMVKWS